MSTAAAAAHPVESRATERWRFAHVSALAAVRFEAQAFARKAAKLAELSRLEAVPAGIRSECARAAAEAQVRAATIRELLRREEAI